MLSNTEYYDSLTQNDIEFRMRKCGASKEELLKASDIPTVEEIVFIKTDMEIESGASGYTHGTQIYLSDDLVTVYALMNVFVQKRQISMIIM